MPPSESSTRAAAALPQTEAFWVRLAPRDRTLRWRYPRVHANVPVQISAPPREPVELTSNDVSVLGLQVRCDRRTAARLRPDPKAVREQVYALRLALTFGRSRVTVSARGRLAHISLIPGAPAEQEVALGFELKAFEGRGGELLERFVSLHLAD